MERTCQLLEQVWRCRKRDRDPRSEVGLCTPEARGEFPSTLETERAYVVHVPSSVCRKSESVSFGPRKAQVSMVDITHPTLWPHLPGPSILQAVST